MIFFPYTPGRLQLPWELAALAWLGLSLAACTRSTMGTVRIPRHDRTPPQVALEVTGMEMDKSQAPASGNREGPTPVELGPDDSLELIARGEDRDGGVKDLALMGKVVATCSGDTGASSRSDSFLRRSVIPELPPGARAPASQSTRLSLRFTDYRKLCPGGDLKALIVVAGVRAENFSGGSEQSSALLFRFVDSSSAFAETGASRPEAGHKRKTHPSQGLPKTQIVGVDELP